MSNHITAMPPGLAPDATPFRQPVRPTQVPQAVEDAFWQRSYRITLNGRFYNGKPSDLYYPCPELRGPLDEAYARYTAAYAASRTRATTPTLPPIAASQPASATSTRTGLQQRPSAPSLVQSATRAGSSIMNQQTRPLPYSIKPATAAQYQPLTRTSTSIASQSRAVIDLTRNETEVSASTSNGAVRISLGTPAAKSYHDAPRDRRASPRATPSSRRVTQTPSALPHLQPAVTTPQRHLGSFPMGEDHNYEQSNSTGPARPAERKASAQSDDVQRETGPKRPKIYIECDHCLRGFPSNPGNNGVHCTQCCNKAKSSGYCVWEAARLALLMKLQTGSEVSAGLNSEVTKQVKACQSMRGASGWCACITSPSIKEGFAAIGAPTGSYFDLQKKKRPTVSPSPNNSGEQPHGAIVPRGQQLPPSSHITHRSTAMVDTHHLPGLIHSAASSPAATSSVASPQTPSGEYDRYRSQDGSTKQVESFRQLPKQPETRKRDVSSIIDEETAGFSEPTRKVAKLSSASPSVLQQNTAISKLDVETLVARYGSLIAAESALAAIPGFVFPPMRW